MNRNVLSELNPSGSDLISTSYFSFLSCYGCMVITIPIHLNVYICEWMCWFCSLDVLEFHPVIAVYLFMHCGRFVDCTHKYLLNLCFCPFSIHFHSFSSTSVTFFNEHLAYTNQALKCFVCSHSKCRKIHQFPMKLRFFKIQNIFFH